MGGAGAAGACPGADHDRDRRQFADAVRRVHRLGLQPPARVGPDGPGPHPVAADVAADAVEPVATAWDAAAQAGLRDRRLYEAANRCLAAAAEQAPAELTDAMARLIRCVERGRCPGDEFSDQVIEHGIEA